MVLQKKLNSSDIGKERIRARFSFLPIRLNDGTLIWLEKYYHRQSVVEGRRLSENIGERYFLWSNDFKFRK